MSDYTNAQYKDIERLKAAFDPVITARNQAISPTDRRLDRVIALLEQMVETNVGLQHILSTAAKLQEKGE